MIFSTALTTNQSAIASITEQIAALQEQLGTLQKQQQALQSLEGASQTAIEQIASVIRMARAIAPEEISAFKSAINSLFENPPIAEIPPTVEDNHSTDNDWNQIDVKIAADEPEIPLTNAALANEEIPTEEPPAATAPHYAEPYGISIKPQNYSNNGRKSSTVGAQQLDIEQLEFSQIKDACKARGIEIQSVRKHGRANTREAWIKAYNAH